MTVRFVDADDGSDDFVFWALSGRSWARVEVAADAAEYRVWQYGLRRLWDEVEAAYRRWTVAGRLPTRRFGRAGRAAGVAGLASHLVAA
ncbi:MAG TPA: hypothetical protein VFU43_00130 [Streptosporangiaceae bacterium]|nr:hypothetical protein [Streptosporangiaceae bacterium]